MNIVNIFSYFKVLIINKHSQRLFRCHLEKIEWKFQKFIPLQYQQEQKRINSMKILTGLRNVVKMGDFFNSNQLLRYDHQTQYRTFTGGLVSLAIITTIIIAFASMILDTVNRITINYTHRLDRGGDPKLSVLNTSLENNFMFGVEVWGYNLSQQYRLFDVVLQQIQSNFGQNYTSTVLPLIPCTEQHWAMLPENSVTFQRLSMGNWLCPEIGETLLLEGRYVSSIYHQISISLYPCSNDTDPNRPCGSRQKLQEFFEEKGQWNYFTFYHINTIVNADQPEFIQYYLQDRSYIVFGNELGAEFDIYVKSIQIQSDYSIWPFQEISQSIAIYLDFSPILYPFAVGQKTSFANFYLMKDPTDEYYSRQVQKIFVVLSFMGGLIGAIMAGLFIINSYTTFAYQISLATQVFRDNVDTRTHKMLKSQSKGAINFFLYFKCLLYQLIKKIKPDIDWPFIEYIQQCREEILWQLDIKGLIKRIIFLQYSISYVLEDYHLAQMQKQKPIQPMEIRKLREKIQARQANNIELQTIDSQKPFLALPQTIIPNISTKEQFQPFPNMLASSFVSKEATRVIEINSKEGEFNQIDEVIVHNKRRHSNQQLKRKDNLRKIRESARQGNVISKKLLLQIIKKPIKEQQSDQSSVENERIQFPQTK